jgi:hypothetical protein
MIVEAPSTAQPAALNLCSTDDNDQQLLHLNNQIIFYKFVAILILIRLMLDVQKSF